MPRSTALLLALATLSATAVAQLAGPGQGNNNFIQSQAAPIERGPNANPGANAHNDYTYRGSLPAGQDLTTTNGTAMAEVAQGVSVRVGPNSTLHSIPTEANGIELRLERGVANVSVNNPADGTLILVDLPGGQSDLVQSGLYTFNAQTNTMRVLHGEADAFPGTTAQSGKAVKVKEDQQYAFTGSGFHASDANRTQITADLLPWNAQPGENGGPNAGANGYAQQRGDGYYGGGPYGDGYVYGYPYAGYAYGYPYYGYGWGYPYGFGLGFGYWGGGFYRGGYGGFRGGYGGGFHGGYGGGFHGGASGGFHGGGGGRR